MAEQPTGTVTMLFTDVEGSTGLLQRLGTQRYSEALDSHRRLLRAAFERNHGYEVDCEGDAFFVAFGDAGAAVAAAVEAQRALASSEWPNGAEIRVRMGMHTGEPMAVRRKYVGLDVHKAARIMAAGHGGQVVVSKATVEAVGSTAWEWTDLGEHRLKDVEEPIWLFQIGGDSFPLLRTISNTNLPAPSSSFVGRERELRELSALLDDGERLVTLSGPGGAGKTRLAIQAAMREIERFPNGVYWVPLASLRDPELVVPAISQVVGPGSCVAASIGDRKLLLVLDNVEQVMDAARVLPDLVEACPELRILVTSRERLRVRGEREIAVRPLSAADAADLFSTRSGLSTDDDAVELCERLDRLPLAIELAAARTNLLSTRQILDRLNSRLDLLKGGRDADPRHATLRATIAWSFELLSANEQLVFARLAVFRGGFTVEAAEAVVDADVDVLQSLVDKSLVGRDGERLGMLETVREFAADRLAAAGEATAVRKRHGSFFLDLAERAESQLRGDERARWLNTLEVERDNLRAALDWAVSADPEIQLRLAAALREFWESRGPLQEGLRSLEQALGRAGDRLPKRRLDALRWGALSALQIHEFAQAEQFATEATALARQLGDAEAEVSALIKLTHAAAGQGANGRAHALIEQAVALARETREPELLARALINYGHLLHTEGDWERAADLAEQAIAVGGDDLKPRYRAIALNNLAEARLALNHADTDITGPLLEVLDLAPMHGDIGLLGSVLEVLAVVEMRTDPLRAATLLGAATALFDQMGEKPDPEKNALVLWQPTVESERAYEFGHSFDVTAAVDYARKRLPTERPVNR